MEMETASASLAQSLPSNELTFLCFLDYLIEINFTPQQKQALFAIKKCVSAQHAGADDPCLNYQFDCQLVAVVLQNPKAIQKVLDAYAYQQADLNLSDLKLLNIPFLLHQRVHLTRLNLNLNPALSLKEVVDLANKLSKSTVIKIGNATFGARESWMSHLTAFSVYVEVENPLFQPLGISLLTHIHPQGYLAEKARTVSFGSIRHRIEVKGDNSEEIASLEGVALLQQRISSLQQAASLNSAPHSRANPASQRDHSPVCYPSVPDLI